MIAGRKTAGEIIAAVDEMKPNAFSTAVKLGWLDELEGRIATDVMLMDVSCVPDLRLSESRTPIVKPPHESLYAKWLAAKIDEGNGDFDRYQNAQIVFDAAWRSFVRFFEETYDPAYGYMI